MDSWEYNAPQFVEFTQDGAEYEDENMEDYFNFDHENGIPVKFEDEEEDCESEELEAKPAQQNTRLTMDTPAKNTRSRSHVPAMVPLPMEQDEEESESHKEPNEEDNSVYYETNEDENKKEEVVEEVKEDKKAAAAAAPVLKAPANLVTSLSSFKTTKTQNQKPDPQSKRPKVRRGSYTLDSSNADTSKATRPNTRNRSIAGTQRRSMVKVPDVTSSPGMKKRKMSHSTPDRRHTTDGTPSKPPRKPTTTTRPPQKLTMPHTPQFMKKMTKTTNSVMSSEEAELARIAALRKELAQKRKKAQNSYKKVQSSTGYMPMRATIEVTQPAEFHFQTDERVKGHASETSQEQVKPEDFVKNLRRSDPISGKVPHGPTVPKPFHLHDNRKRKRAMEAEKDTGHNYHSMAETVINFAKKTPERFRTRPRNKGPDVKQPQGPSHLTIPKTPNFGPQRRRPVTVVSQAEIDEQEAEACKKNQFKAHKVNYKILNNPNHGVRKIPSKEVTVPQPFDLAPSGTASDKSVDKSQEEEEKFEFHAKPVPAKILEKTTGIKKVKSQALTVPESPAFALKNRKRAVFEHKEEMEEECKMLKAKPPVHVGIPFQPQLEHKVTVPAPFSFDSKIEATRQKKEALIHSVLEEEQKAREFHAQMLPYMDSPERLPDVSKKPCTNPEPFDLEADKRAAVKAEEWGHKMEEELRQQREMRSFKAHPADVTHKEPFIPKKSTKPLTDVSDFELNTSRRSEQRHHYEEWKKEKEQQKDAIHRHNEEQQVKEEEAEIRRLRQEMVHKPRPIQKYRPVEIHGSERPLTTAESPRFSERLRSKRF